MNERYSENIEWSLKKYEDKSFEELMIRAEEIFETLRSVDELVGEVIEIQGVLTARILKGDVE